MSNLENKIIELYVNNRDAPNDWLKLFLGNLHLDRLKLVTGQTNPGKWLVRKIQHFLVHEW